MTKQVPSRRLTRSDAVGFLHKAEEFLEAGRAAFQAGHFSACANCAVHAGISAADAITGFELLKRSTGKDHRQTLTLLKDAKEGGKATKELGPLLTLKPRAQYDPVPTRKDAAERALERAERLIHLARKAGERTADS